MEGINQVSDQELLQCVRINQDDEALEILFQRYLPVLHKLRRQYFLRGMEFDDWQQEARLILHRCAQQFDTSRSRSFGVFYSLGLKHRVFDLIRQGQAKRRLPLGIETSYEAHAAFFDDQLIDLRVDPGMTVMVREIFRATLAYLSPLERQVMLGLNAGHTPSELAAELVVSHSQVKAAMQRCKQKLIRQLHSRQPA